MASVVEAVRGKIVALTTALETQIDADVVGVFGPIAGGIASSIRNAIELLPKRRNSLAIVLHTGGGSIQIAERIVGTLRHYYPASVRFIVPDIAMSVGTVLAMSGDAIMMDFFSVLGPIDPQVEKDGKLVPAMSYLEQYNRLVKRSAEGQLTTAELAMANKLDLAELHLFEQASKLSIELLEVWLAKYKFKDWHTTETSKTPVTQEMKVRRAREIATSLNDHNRWRSHGRGIPMQTLQSELKLRIDDFGQNEALAKAIKKYFGMIISVMTKEGFTQFVTSRKSI